MTNSKNSPFRATLRALKGHLYYYIAKDKTGYRVFACYETGHPLDEEHFREGNYHLTAGDAENAIRWREESLRWREWRQEYLEQLHEMKRRSAARLQTI